MELNKLKLEFNPSEETVTKDRDLYIGGSDVPIIMGVSAFNDAYSLKLEKLGLKEKKLPTDGNYYTNYGHSIEPYIRDYVNKQKNMNFQVACGINETDGIRCNFDGLDVKNEMILEVKSNGGNHDDITDYLYQMYLYMNQSGIDKGLLAMYTRNDVEDYMNIKPEEFKPENLTIVEVNYDPIKAEEILKTIESFRNIGMNDIETSIDFYSKLYNIDKNEVSNIKDELEKFVDLKTMEVFISDKLKEIDEMLLNESVIKEDLEKYNIFEGEYFTVKGEEEKESFSSEAFFKQNLDKELTEDEKKQVLKTSISETQTLYVEKPFKNFVETKTNRNLDKINDILNLRNVENIEDVLLNRDILTKYKAILKTMIDSTKEESKEIFADKKNLRDAEFNNGFIKITYPNPKEKISINYSTLKKIRPDLYEKSLTLTKSKISLTKFKIKDNSMSKDEMLQNMMQFKGFVIDMIKNKEDVLEYSNEKNQTKLLNREIQNKKEIKNETSEKQETIQTSKGRRKTQTNK